MSPDTKSLAAPPAPWRLIGAADLGAVTALGNRIHAGLQESPAVFAERQALFPAGAWLAEQGGAIVAYALFHPWRAGRPPKLDTLLGALPAAADVLYLHDVAVDPPARALGLARRLVERLPGIARALSLPALELVAVPGTDRFWAGHGFVRIDDPALAGALAKYGDGASLMRRMV